MRQRGDGEWQAKDVRKVNGQCSWCLGGVKKENKSEVEGMKAAVEEGSGPGAKCRADGISCLSGRNCSNYNVLSVQTISTSVFGLVKTSAVSVRAWRRGAGIRLGAEKARTSFYCLLWNLTPPRYRRPTERCRETDSSPRSSRTDTVKTQTELAVGRQWSKKKGNQTASPANGKTEELKLTDNISISVLLSSFYFIIFN